jgi:hypothetical protein
MSKKKGRDEDRSTMRGYAMPNVAERVARKGASAPGAGTPGDGARDGSPPGGERAPTAVGPDESTTRSVAGPAAQPRGSDEPPHGPRPLGQPAIDVELVLERRTTPYVDRPWPAVEIWTQNRVYSLDAGLRCLEVVDKATGKPEPRHPLIGAHLVGGQHEEGDGVMELSHPFPRVGSEAVFEQQSGSNARFSHTSSVERVVLRLRVLQVTPDRTVPAWQDITARFGPSRR